MQPPDLEISFIRVLTIRLKTYVYSECCSGSLCVRSPIHKSHSKEYTKSTNPHFQFQSASLKSPTLSRNSQIVILFPNKSIKTPRQGTKKNPAYWSTAVYQPAVTASVPNRISANSVAFCVNTIAVLVSKSENSIIIQKIQGSSRNFLSSNFLFFSVRISPVEGSGGDLKCEAQ